MSKSTAEILFCKHLIELGMDFTQEVRFHRLRKWRFDFLLDSGIAIEIDGYHNGRHGAGWGADNDKRNAATMMGYRVLTFSTTDVLKGRAKAFLAEHLKANKTRKYCLH